MVYGDCYGVLCKGVLYVTQDSNRFVEGVVRCPCGRPIDLGAVALQVIWVLFAPMCFAVRALGAVIGVDEDFPTVVLSAARALTFGRTTNRLLGMIYRG